VSKFRAVCIFFDQIPPGQVVWRRVYLGHFKSRGLDSYETYRNLLTHAGFIETAKRGVYRRTQKTGLDTLTYAEAWRLAGFKGEGNPPHK